MFEGDSAVREAIVYQIAVMGEAAKPVLATNPSLAERLPDIQWSELARKRDKVTHLYWAVNAEIVWSTAAQDFAADSHPHREEHRARVKPGCHIAR